MASNKKGKYEKAAWILLYVGLGLTVVSTVLFFFNRTYLSSQPIDNEVFGHFGALIGGLVGTIVALVSFFLLYETLNEQRLQFLKQQQDTEYALSEQRNQIQKQSEDQIFYRILDKQQHRIINSTLTNQKKSFIGYHIFQFLADELKSRLLEECHLLARRLICDDPASIQDLFLIKLFTAHDSGFRPDEFESKKDPFISDLLERDKNERWEYIKYYFGSVGDEPPNLKGVLLAIGSVMFYKIDFKYREHLYNNTFATLTQDYGYFLDGYLKEMQFIPRLIDNTINASEYNSYFVTQTTKYEVVIIFYYLLSGEGTRELLDFVKGNNLFSNMYKDSSLLIDLPSDKELRTEIQNMEFLYPD